MSKVRIASVIKRLHYGGDETRLLSLATHLDTERFDHRVVVVQSVEEDPDRRTGPMLAAFQDAGVDVVVLGRDIVSVTATPAPVSAGPGRRLADVAAAGSVLRGLVRIFREYQPHVVDGRLNFGTVFGLAAARIAGAPVVVSTGYFPEHWRRPPLMEPVGQLALSQVDAFITDAEATSTAFDRWRWSKRARMVVIPNGVPPATSTRQRDEVRQHLGLPGDPGIRVVGCVCRMVEGKGYPTFVRAARSIRDRCPDVAFLFCGYAEDAAFRRGLVDLADELGIRDRAVFTGYPGPVGDVLAALDVYVRPSLEDSSPIGVHEAMSAGLPIVATRVGGVPELVEDEVSALLVPPDDADALADAVTRLLHDPALAERLGRNASSRFTARHLPDQMARAHEELFLDLVEAKEGRR